MERLVKNKTRNKPASRTNFLKKLTRPEDGETGPDHEERQVGDGAPAEMMCEPTNKETHEGSQHPGSWLRWRVEVDPICMGLFLLALITRFYHLGEPRHIVFDELHYGRYVSLYSRGVFFFDPHPPLGKQLLYFVAHAVGYSGNFTFDRIGTAYPPEVPVWALRALPALAGSLLAPLAYHLLALLGASQWSAALAAGLVLCENSLLVQSRFMLLEPLLLAFSLSGVVCALRAGRSTSDVGRVFWTAMAAVLLACCFSVKFAGLYSYLLGSWVVLASWWRQLGDRQRSAGALIAQLAWRSAALVCVPLAVYLAVFYLHLATLTKAGPHDSAMTSAFQASLEGGLASITRGQPLHVAHGSQITLRHAAGRACWLHSHAHVYPVRYADSRGSSHQQQVTCYSFKDVNNWWIVKRPDKTDLTVETPADVIRHGERVQLVHGITSRALNSHDVAAPVSPHAQEVSCYIDYNVSMPTQNVWRVDIVNRKTEDATWDSIASHVRLIHDATGAALKYSGRQLPDWGFHQHEVVGDRGAVGQDTVWNVEEHRYTALSEDRKERERQLASAEMIPTTAPRLSFLDKFWELQRKLLLGTADAPHNHMFSSEPTDWPLLARPIAYWVSAHSNAQVHLIGNPVIWYTGTLSLITYGAILAAYLLRRRRHICDLSEDEWRRFCDAGATLAGGYLLHYLPYYFVERTLFLHHYLPAYLYKILLLAYVVEHIHSRLPGAWARAFAAAAAAWAAFAAHTCERFAALNYGTVDLTEADLTRLRWRDTWDFILHKK